MNEFSEQKEDLKKEFDEEEKERHKRLKKFFDYTLAMHSTLHYYVPNQDQENRSF